MVPPRLLVLTPPGPAPAVGVLHEGEGVTLLVKLGFRQEQVVPSTLDPEDFAPRKTKRDVSVDGRRIEVPLDGDLRPHGVELPAVQPKVALCDAELGAVLPIVMVCDTVSKEGDQLSLVWRGHVEASAFEERDRVQVTLADDLGEPARAQVFFAETPEGVEVDADILELERLALAEHTPQPSMPLETYATIGAELAEQREPRADVLARHGLDERAWGLEERAWLERMGSAAMDGDASLAVAYSDHFVAAQDALGSGEDRDAMIHDYVAVSVELERADDPLPVLHRWSLSLAQWFRLDRHWSGRAAADERLKAEIERMMALEREREDEE